MPWLEGIAAFARMDPIHRDRLEKAGTLSEPRDGAEVFSQGDPADAVYAIVGGDGRVRIVAIDRRSKAVLAEVFRAGDIFGEMGVIDGGARSATAVAEGRVRLMRLPGATFLDALSRSAPLGEALSRSLVRRLRRTFELFQDASFETLEVRLARQVLYLAEREGRQTEQGLRLARRLRQGDLADLLGGTTRSIITILNGWRAAGLVLYDTERALLTLRHPQALRALLGSEAEEGPPIAPP
jgi:CRP/FNR family transcriptional regulator, cyclic AMP receptor protein